MEKIPLRERFWGKVDRGNINGCWDWMGRLNGGGYGIFSWRGAKVSAPRISYFLSHQTMPNRPVRHACGNRRCVRPDHLVQQPEGKRARRRGRGGLSLGLPSQGSAHGRSKLTEEQVLTMRQERAGGDTLAVLSGRYGVAMSLISMIVNRHRWKHVP